MAADEDFMSTDTTDISSTFDPTLDPSYYSSIYGDEACDRTSTLLFSSIFTPVFLSIVMVLSLFGNILVIVIFAKYENLKLLTNAFILNLAVSGLFFTAGLPFWAYYSVDGWNLGEAACKIVNFVFYVGFYSSGVLLILMTAHRYVAVMNPLSDIESTSGFYSVLASVIIWAASIFIASPAFLFTKVMGENHCVFANSYWSLFGIYQQNIVFILIAVVFTFCYSQNFCRLVCPTTRRRKNKTLKLIFTLMVVFFVGWAPYNIVIFQKSFYLWNQQPFDSEVLAAACEAETPLDYEFDLCRILALSHCCLNPVFYVFVGVKFKNHLKKMLKCRGHSTSNIRSRHSRLTITSVTSGEEFSMQSL